VIPGLDYIAPMSDAFRTLIDTFGKGWERGDVAALAVEARALQRASYRLVWLNPLAGTRGYAAEAAGARALAAAVDDHLAANTLDGLAAIAALLAKAGRGRPVRRQGGQ